MHATLKFVAVALAGAAVGSILLGARPVTAADGDSLADRVTQLEKVVLRDPMRPNTSVTDRLDALEKSLKLGPGDIKTPDDLKAAVMKASIAQDDLDRRMKAVERAKAADNNDAAERQVRDLKRQIEDQGRDIRDLQQQVRSARIRP
ncbi:MAG TPA: hypothetical protein VF595_09285 [Tepidisphaeraceae bacterium]|jgi:hypothetical protein